MFATNALTVWYTYRYIINSHNNLGLYSYAYGIYSVNVCLDIFSFFFIYSSREAGMYRGIATSRERPARIK